MLRVGLTGGIGSGKTTIAKMFESYGVPVYYADERAKHLMTESSVIRKKLIDTFGEQAFDGRQLNRSYLANIVFNDLEALKKINAIVHPEVRKDFEAWIHRQDTDWVIQENAILFESGMNKNFDKIITVTAPVEERVKRVMQRDGVTKEQVISRIKNQLHDEEKIGASDYVIVNIDLKKSRKEVEKIIFNLERFTS